MNERGVTDRVWRWLAAGAVVVLVPLAAACSKDAKPENIVAQGPTQAHLPSPDSIDRTTSAIPAHQPSPDSIDRVRAAGAYDGARASDWSYYRG
jgi:hypothetical protein